jgi:hypothetical protein
MRVKTDHSFWGYVIGAGKKLRLLGPNYLQIGVKISAHISTLSQSLTYSKLHVVEPPTSADE